MTLKNLLVSIDAEIMRLQKARALLAKTENAIPTFAARRGRPKKTAPESTSMGAKSKKRNLSPEGRARIAAAVKRRWARQKANS